MKFLMKLACCALVLLPAAGCKKDKLPQKPTVLVNPTSIYVSSKVGNVQGFRIDASSPGTLSKIKITMKPGSSGTVTLMDTSVSVQSISFTYEHLMLQEYADQELLFTFEATDTDGNTGSAARKVFVENNVYSLTETAGHKMFSWTSSDYAGYDLENGIQRSLWEDWTLIDIAEVQDTTLQSPTENLRSPNGARFVRYNGFDYANATNITAETAYKSGVEQIDLTDINTGDIIIVKLAFNECCPYVVMKITDIKDNPGTGNDYYQFSLKK